MVEFGLAAQLLIENRDELLLGHFSSCAELIKHFTQ